MTTSTLEDQFLEQLAKSHQLFQMVNKERNDAIELIERSNIAKAEAENNIAEYANKLVLLEQEIVDLNEQIKDEKGGNIHLAGLLSKSKTDFSELLSLIHKLAEQDESLAEIINEVLL